jgi:hypothetical protein
MRKALAIAPAIAVFLLHCLGHGAVFVDDAYIFYRYAANWAAGYGLVYNVGEYVEGFSSLFWTMLLAVGARGSVSPEILGPTLGILSGIASLVLLSYSSPLVMPNSHALRVALPVACSLSTGFTYYAMSGMDTLLFATVLLSTVLAARIAAEGNSIAALSLCLPLLVVARAEGFLYAIVMLGSLGLAIVRGFERVALTGRRYGIVVVLTLAAVAVQFSGRWLVYRDWLPATVSAKGYTNHTLGSLFDAGSPGFGPVVSALKEGIRYEMFVLPIAVVPCLMLGLNTVRRRTQRVFPLLLATPIAVNVVVTVWASGDWMDYHRLIVPVWPLWLLLLAWSLPLAIPASVRPRLANLVVVSIILCSGVYAVEEPLNPLSFSTASAFQEQGRSLFKRQVGSRLHHFGGPVTVVTNVAGKMPYYAGPRTYARDLLGLTDAHNAKHGDVWTPTYGRTDYEYSFGRPFDLLVTNSYTDLDYLLTHWDDYPAGRSQYRLYQSEEWTANCFFVVAKVDHAVAPLIQSLCNCQPDVLGERFLQFVRSLPRCSGAADEDQ